MQDNSLYKELFELYSDGLCISTNNKILFCNDVFVKMLGYESQEEILNSHPAELSPEYQEDGSQSYEKANKIFKMASGKAVEWLHKKKNGKLLECEVTLKPISCNGQASIFSIVKDISEKRKLERDLRDALNEDLKKFKELFESIFNSNMYAIALLDLKSNFLLVNDTYTTLTGFTKEEFYTKSCVSLTHPDDIIHSRENLEALQKNGFYKSFEKRCMMKNGNYVNVIMDAVALHDKEKILIVVKDISQEKQYQKEQVLHDQQMLQQSRLAQMGEMISMIAHQWRQPLSAISTTAVNLKMKLEFESLDLDTKEGIEEASRYFVEKLDNIENFVGTLTNTIDDFRNFYKPNKESSICKLEEVFSKVLEIIKSSLKNENIEIDYTSYETKALNIYQSEMMQVLLNILKNAQDNFKEKKIKNPKITIVVEDTKISICDNGGGIQKQTMEQIFDPYFSTKSAKNGTGLGLYMSKIIVEEHHGGKLYAENRDDGVCFIIDLSGGG